MHPSWAKKEVPFFFPSYSKVANKTLLYIHTSSSMQFRNADLTSSWYIFQL